MKNPVWQAQSKGTPSSAFIAFSAGRDVMPLPEADRILVPFDIWTNQAHAIGLSDIGVYRKKELKTVLAALRQLEADWMEGRFKLDPQLEDVHINIESYISRVCGDSIGGRLHTGRSRNDQVATDMKLYLREVILQFAEEIYGLADSITKHARKNVDAVMPGYTHHRKATVTTWGHWCLSYVQGLLRDAQRLQSLFDRLNECPLGAAAAYGTTWTLNRELVAKLLGFDRLQENTLDCIGSRGEAECETALALSLLLKRLSRISQDLIVFSTDAFGYLILTSAFTTGSSIMPQKRNPDFAEAIKGKFHVVQGMAHSLMSIDSCNLSGYNKDNQWSKYLLLDAVRESFGAATLLADVFQGMHIKKLVMAKDAEGGFLNAVDLADYLASSRGMAFRETYHLISEAVGLSKENRFDRDSLNALLSSNDLKILSEDEFQQLTDPQKCLRNRIHTGSPHPDRVLEHIERLKTEQKTLKSWYNQKRKALEKAQKRCAEYIK